MNLRVPGFVRLWRAPGLWIRHFAFTPAGLDLVAGVFRWSGPGSSLLDDHHEEKEAENSQAHCIWQNSVHQIK